MALEVGLSIGESFAELHARSADTSIQNRWYLPRKGLPDGIKESLKSIRGGGTLRVATNSMTRILEKSQGRAAAVVVTSGFETWLSYRQPFTTAPFAIRAKRRSLPIENDLVFGLNERVQSDGTIHTKLEIADLEFLAAKFELSKVKDVALCLLNSGVNSEHEMMAASFFREKGYRVFLSHRVGDPSQENRWRQTIENAFAESALLEEKEQIETVTKALQGEWKLEVWTPEGPQTFREYTSSMVRGGFDAALQSATSGFTLHCGLDGFKVLGAAPSVVNLWPTGRIRHGVWTFPTLSEDSTGYAPGPMAFGRSQTLAMLDILYVRDRLQEVEALTPLLNDKSRTRILESLFTLGKSQHAADAQKRPPEAVEIATDLERAFVERCAICLASTGAEKNVTLTGALAETMLPLLKLRRSDLKFKSDVDLRYFEGQAATGVSRGSSK